MCEIGKKFLAIGEAAQLLETTEMRVLMMLKKKELVGELNGEEWQIDKASFNLCVKPEASGIVRPGVGCGGCGSGCSPK